LLAALHPFPKSVWNATKGCPVVSSTASMRLSQTYAAHDMSQSVLAKSQSRNNPRLTFIFIYRFALRFFRPFRADLSIRRSSSFFPPLIAATSQRGLGGIAGMGTVSGCVANPEKRSTSLRGTRVALAPADRCPVSARGAAFLWQPQPPAGAATPPRVGLAWRGFSEASMPDVIDQRATALPRAARVRNKGTIW